MQNQRPKTILPGLDFATPKPRLNSMHTGWQRVRLISGVFILLAAAAMLIENLASSTLDPLKSPKLTALKDKLRQNPADESVKQEIRQLDLQLRADYFGRLSRSGSGVYLLLGGGAVFVLAWSQCNRFEKKPPMPQPRTEPLNTAGIARTARWSAGVGGAAVTAVLLVLGLVTGKARTDSPVKDSQIIGSQTPAASQAVSSEEELKRNWPRFRGQGGNGVSEAKNIPQSWDTKTGSGIAWKTPVPAPGFNSPVIWRGNFFISGGDAARREVFCYECSTGKLVWRQPVENVPGAPTKVPEVPETTGYAAPSVATDGQRVYAIFATGDVAAFTLEGKPVWSRSFGPLKNPYGHATSLLTWKDRLIVLLDQGESEDGKSKLYALDGRTGKTVWETPRKVGASWATPVTFEAAGEAQVVALAIPWAISYGLKDGVELWRVEGLNGEVTPSPAFAQGLVLVPSPSEKLFAIRPDGHGDVTKTQVVWSTEENVPDVTSPVGTGDLVFTLTTPGVLTCFEAKDGKKLWEHDFEMECHASPSIAEGRVYLFGQKGTAIITEAGRQFKELFRTEMPDMLHASPAFVDNTMILRGSTNLWGIVSPPK